MILVTVGTVSFTFQRLLNHAVELLSLQSEPVILQTGSYQLNSLPAHFSAHSFIESAQMIKYYQEASLVIAASGEGTIFQILHYSQRPPILFPRLSIYKEHIDDQQKAIAEAVAQKGLAYVALNRDELINCLISFYEHEMLQPLKKPSIHHPRLRVNRKLITLLETQVSHHK